MCGWDVKIIPQVMNWNGTPSKGVFVLTRGKAAPAHKDARLTRSRVLARLDQLQAAVQDLSFVISRSPAPTPEIYLERAQLLVREALNS